MANMFAIPNVFRSNSCKLGELITRMVLRAKQEGPGLCLKNYWSSWLYLFVWKYLKFQIYHIAVHDILFVFSISLCRFLSWKPSISLLQEQDLLSKRNEVKARIDGFITEQVNSKLEELSRDLKLIGTAIHNGHEASWFVIDWLNYRLIYRWSSVTNM